MLIQAVAGLGLLVIGIIFGARLGSSRGRASVAEIENKAEVARDKARQAASNETRKKLEAVKAEAHESNSRPVSDVLVDLIEKGELKR